MIGESLTGLDLISEYGLHGKSILVTSHYSDRKIQANCTRLGVKMIPKESVVNLFIKSGVETKIKEIVLIDDDQFTHLSWKRSSLEQDFKLHGFYSVDEFLNSAEKFNLNTPIFIDSNLGENKKGEVLSEDIFKLGFTELYLATGMSKADIVQPYWIKGVHGKRFSSDFIN